MDIVLNTRFNNPNLPVIQIPGFYDDFNRPAADTLGVTSGEGRAWELLDVGVNPSTWAIDSSGSAYLKTAGSSYQSVVVDGYSPDGTLTATATSVGSNNERWGGLAFRAVDAQNHLMISEVSSSDQRIALLARVGGTRTNLGTSSETLASGDELSVHFEGPSIEVFRNGESILSVSNSLYASATKHGFTAANGTVAKWDDIEFVPYAG